VLRKILKLQLLIHQIQFLLIHQFLIQCNQCYHFFFIPFTQNSNNNNPNPLPLHASSSPQQPILSLDEFFSKLDEEFAQFKNIFEDERITVDQIYDLTDIEFNQLGISKIGWRKAFRAAAQRYKK
jgi:hypothetical protein